MTTKLIDVEKHPYLGKTERVSCTPESAGSVDQRLELLSDKVRRGEPVGFAEALEVIEYQNSKPKPKTWLSKLKDLFKPTK